MPSNRSGTTVGWVLVLLDLDGTLTDPYDGITRSVTYALDGLGLPRLEERQLRSFIGPPLQDQFAALGLDEGDVGRAVVPGRSRSIQARDFTGMDTASVGLVRRVENMVSDTPNYRDELNRRHEHALTRIADLEAVADEPFEHTDALRVKRYRLDTLTAALQTSAALSFTPATAPASMS